MADETADALRDMALHRGLKLLRSRRRKPGTGDFGKFGLTDAAGKPLLGIGEDGLTATAAEIEDYLRAGATSTWAQSAKLTPDRPPAASAPSPPQGAQPKRTKTPVARETTPRSQAPSPRTTGKRTTPKAAPAASPAPAPSPDPARARAPRPAPATAPPPAEPKLTLRAAKASDAAALAVLLGLLAGVRLSEHEAARHLAAVRKSGGGVDVAEFGSTEKTVVGCAAWSVVPTLQRGPIGRITALVVAERHRRRAIAKALLARAEADLAKKGCKLLEVMSDTDLKNSHGFFRSLDFEQKSYRFVRAIAPA